MTLNEKEEKKIKSVLKELENVPHEIVIGLLFYKFINEQQRFYLGFDDPGNPNDSETYQQWIKDNLIQSLGYYIVPEYRDNVILDRIKQEKDIINYLYEAFTSIEDSSIGFTNHWIYSNIFHNVDLDDESIGTTRYERNVVISRAVLSLNNIDFIFPEDEKCIIDQNRTSEIAYTLFERIIFDFQNRTDIRLKQEYTPELINKIMYGLLNSMDHNTTSIYDPCSGYGQTITNMAKLAEIFYANDENYHMYIYTKMNLIIHGVDIRNLEVTNNNIFLEDKDFKVDTIVSDIPIHSALHEKPNFSYFDGYGREATWNFAFIHNMLQHISDDGVIITTTNHLAWYEYYPEHKYKKELVESNMIDTMILIPSRNNVNQDQIIVILDKKKTNSDIFVINASELINYTLDIDADTDETIKETVNQEDINKIIDIYKNKKEIDKYSFFLPKYIIRKWAYRFATIKPETITPYEQLKQINHDFKVFYYKHDLNDEKLLDLMDEMVEYDEWVEPEEIGWETEFPLRKRDIEMQPFKYMSGCEYYIRDHNLDEKLIENYEVGEIITDPTYVDCTYKKTGINTSHRTLIVSDQMMDISEHEHGTNWGLCITVTNQTFKIIDIYKKQGKTQITLLQLNPMLIDLFEDHQTDFEKELIINTRKYFDECLEMDVLPELDTDDWKGRCYFPIGLNEDGSLFHRDF